LRSLIANSTTIRIIRTSLFVFSYYLTIGLLLAVVPGFVHLHLGLSPLWAGAKVSSQYLATLVTRPKVGRTTDVLGPRATVCGGATAHDVALCGGSSQRMWLRPGISSSWGGGSQNGCCLKSRAALGVYTAFLDLAMGITGPIAGFIVGKFGYSAIFLYGSGLRLARLCLVFSSPSITWFVSRTQTSRGRHSSRWRLEKQGSFILIAWSRQRPQRRGRYADGRVQGRSPFASNRHRTTTNVCP
jgi:hypothetical protein